MEQQPIDITKPLYCHQLISIKNMMRLEEEKTVAAAPLESGLPSRTFYTKIGILSDLTGYGKTLSMLGLISSDKKWDIGGGVYIDSKRSGTDTLCQEEYDHYEKKDCNLVILNSVLLSQWENEICQNTKLTYQKVSSRRDIHKLGEEGCPPCDIVLCDYQYYNSLRIKFSRVAWKRIIVDEPNTLRINDSKMICGFIWFVTATPYVLIEKNRYPTLLGAPTISMLNAIIVKNDDDLVRKSFEMPPNTIIRYKCRNMIYDILKGNIQKNIEDLAAADNISGLLEYMGAERGTQSSVIDLILKRKLDKLEEIKKLSEIRSSEKLSERYQNIRSEIERIGASFKEALETTNCPICLENYKEPSVVSCCQNIFCGKCITSVLFQNPHPPKCPLCRQHITVRNVICVNIETAPPSSGAVGYKSKSQTILEIILGSKKGRHIIYSDYSDSFDTLKRYLSEREIKYSELKGVKSQREKTLENYRTGGVGVLFLTTLQYSAGIDLLNTTDIILYHDMNESTKIQIIGRANRIGRTIPLKIHCMF